MFPQSFTKNTALPYYTYDQRGLLRNWSPQDGAQALVDSLGMFVYSNSNSQILDNNNVNTYQAYDDDESCFLTGNGAWLLEYPHWDVINSWYLPDIEALYSTTNATNAAYFTNNQVPGSLAKFYTNSTSGRAGFYFGSAVTTITSVVASGIASQSIAVTGASLGDAAIVNPSVNFTGGGVSVYCYVSAANTVTLYVTGIGATVNLISSAVWYVTVIKKS
jgi:hypothetical protein